MYTCCESSATDFVRNNCHVSWAAVAVSRSSHEPQQPYYDTISWEPWYTVCTTIHNTMAKYSFPLISHFSQWLINWYIHSLSSTGPQHCLAMYNLAVTLLKVLWNLWEQLTKWHICMFDSLFDSLPLLFVWHVYRFTNDLCLLSRLLQLFHRLKYKPLQQFTIEVAGQILQRSCWVSE